MQENMVYLRILKSFAIYGTRKYFTDSNRGVVLRLSQDGLTEVSKNGFI